MLINNIQNQIRVLHSTPTNKPVSFGDTLSDTYAPTKDVFTREQTDCIQSMIDASLEKATLNLHQELNVLNLIKEALRPKTGIMEFKNK